MIDLSCLNRSVDVSHFHMETLQSVLQSLQLGDWMVSLDPQDAYLQVPVHPSSHQFLRFYVGDSVYQFCCLCFGLSTVPQVFTRVMALVSSIMHHYGFRILRYLDDWLVLGSSFQEIVLARDFLLWLCQEQGIRVNLAKSSDAFPVDRLSGDEASDVSFEGFPDPQTCPEAILSRSRLLVLSSASFLSCRHVFDVLSGSGVAVSHAVPSAAAECGGSFSGRHRRVVS